MFSSYFIGYHRYYITVKLLCIFIPFHRLVDYAKHHLCLPNPKTQFLKKSMFHQAPRSLRLMYPFLQALPNLPLCHPRSQKALQRPKVLFQSIMIQFNQQTNTMNFLRNHGGVFYILGLIIGFVVLNIASNFIYNKFIEPKTLSLENSADLETGEDVDCNVLGI